MDGLVRERNEEFECTRARRMKRHGVHEFGRGDLILNILIALVFKYEYLYMCFIVLKKNVGIRI